MKPELLFPEISPAESSAQTERSNRRKTSGTGPASSRKRRKKATRQVDDYYALLAVDENATPDILKRAYIEQVKQYPPEAHPDEFKKIRLAYDTLRDETLRKEYDILRKYGESIEDLVYEATSGNITANTVKLLERAIAIDPQNIPARLTIAYAYAKRANFAAVEHQFIELKEIVPPEKWPAVWCNKITLLLQVRRFEDAYIELQHLQEELPATIGKFWNLYLNVYAAVGRESQFLSEIARKIQENAAPTAADIGLYIAWIQIADSLDERGKCAKAQAAAKQFLKKFSGRDDIHLLVAALTEEYHKCREHADFRGAKIFADLAVSIDKSNQELKQSAMQVQTVESMLNEIDRAMADRKIFPLVLLDVLHWITDEFHVMDDALEQLTDALPEEFMEELQVMAEAYAAGIIHLKKRYPVIYRYYQQRWQDLFKEKTAGLNREERRSLRL